MKIAWNAPVAILAERFKRVWAGSPVTPELKLKAWRIQAAGAAQELYGQAADTARETVSSFEKALRHTIETQPYTSALVALGLGWLLGRMHRPL
jgi:hypothetical protein